MGFVLLISVCGCKKVTDDYSSSETENTVSEEIETAQEISLLYSYTDSFNKTIIQKQ